MNPAKVTLTATVLAAALGLGLSFGAPPAKAHCPDHAHCDGGGGGGGGGGGHSLPAQVTFFYGNSAAGPSPEPFIAGDGGGAYVDGVDKLEIIVPDGEDNAAPGQFQFFTGESKKATRRVYINFGPRVGDDDDQVENNVGAAVECPFPPGTGEELDCAGLVQAVMSVRDPISIVGGVVVDDGLFVTMPDGIVSLSRAQEAEFLFSVDRQQWTVNFEDVSCNVPPAPEGFLDIVAFDLDPTNEIREEWAVGTDLNSNGDLGLGTKTGCLVRNSKGGTPEETIGNFDFSYGYLIELIQ